MSAQPKARIRKKMVTATGGVLLLVAVFMSVFFPWRQKLAMVHYMEDKMVAVASLTSVNAEAGLVFEDASVVKESLQGLNSLDDLAWGLVLDANGKAFASYKHSGSTSEEAKELTEAEIATETATLGTALQAIAKGAPREIIHTADNLTVVMPITSGDQRMGAMVLSLNRAGLNGDVATSRWTSIAISVFILLGGTFAFSLFAQRISKPLGVLEEAANKVASGDTSVQVERDHGRRAGKPGCRLQPDGGQDPRRAGRK
jgi:methyl-accepting chemotaxis protein